MNIFIMFSIGQLITIILTYRHFKKRYGKIYSFDKIAIFLVSFVWPGILLLAIIDWLEQKIEKYFFL